MPDNYKYDVFLSYKHDELLTPWVAQFEKRLEFWLTQELGGRKARIFFDEQSIEAGDHWPEKIRSALRTSCCMVGIWTPEYFRSRWCVSEWKSFVAREKLIGTQVEGLVLPIKFCDGTHFPPEAKAVEQLDCSHFASTFSTFWESQQAIAIDSKIQKLVANIARTLKNIPQFQEDFPTIDAEPDELQDVPLRRL